MRLFHYFKSCFAYLETRERRDFMLVLLLGVAAAAFELLGLASIIPVIAFIVGGQEASLVSAILPVAKVMPVANPALGLGLLCVAAITVGVLVSLLYAFARNRFSQRLAASLVARVLENYLDDSVDVFYSRAEGEMLRNVGEVGDRVANGVIQGGLHIITRIALLLLILMVLVNVNFVLTLTITFVLALVYVFVHRGVRRYVQRAASTNFTAFRNLHQMKIDAYKSYRQIVMDGLVDWVVHGFSRTRRAAGRRSANIAILGEVPRHLLEAMGIILLILSAIVLSERENADTLMPNMAIFALAAFRILPALQQIYSSINQMTAVMGVEKTIQAALAPRIKRTEGGESGREAGFQKISVEAVSYTYPGSGSSIFTDFSLEISLQGVVLVRGPSGAGKSTLFDLLMAFRSPDVGRIYIDGLPVESVRPEWWRECTFVPQDFAAFGDDLRESIILSDSGAYDTERYSRALTVSGLSGVMQYRGIDDHSPLSELKLSGGEKNRLALARALYSGAGTVFMDEPLSGLDIEAARSLVIDMVKSYPEKCFIVITHREAEFADIKDKLLIDINPG